MNALATLPQPRRFKPLYRVIRFGCPEYLAHRGFCPGGELELIELRPFVPTIASIKDAVAEHFQVSKAEMTSARRHRDVARPRQVAMYLSKELTPRSLPEIGRRFGWRDHTTVIHGIRQIERLRAVDPELDRDIRFLTAKLTGECDYARA